MANQEDYATIDDLQARWRPLDTDEKPAAQARLHDASVILRATLNGRAPDPELCRIVVCQMVKRAMNAPTVPDGLSGLSQTAGPFSQNLQFSNPDGNMYLTRAEKKMLGVNQVAGYVDMFPDVPPNPWGDCE